MAHWLVLRVVFWVRFLPPPVRTFSFQAWLCQGSLRAWSWPAVFSLTNKSGKTVRRVSAASSFLGGLGVLDFPLAERVRADRGPCGTKRSRKWRKGVMNVEFSAAWKNYTRHRIGQFELSHVQHPAHHSLEHHGRTSLINARRFWSGSRKKAIHNSWSGSFAIR